MHKNGINIFKFKFMQFIKFGFVGAVNTLTSLAIYYLLVLIDIDYILSTIIGYVISSIVGYILNKLWVFKSKGDKVYRSIIKFYVIYGFSLLLNVGCMYLWINILSLTKYIAPVLTLCITIPFNFIFSKMWVFKSNTINPRGDMSNGDNA